MAKTSMLYLLDIFLSVEFFLSEIINVLLIKSKLFLRLLITISNKHNTSKVSLIY